MIPTIFLVALTTFFLFRFAPVQAPTAILGDSATPEAIVKLEREMGLDQSAPVLFARWLGSAVRGDFGRSYATNRDVAKEIIPRIPVTLVLATGGLLVALMIGIPAGITAATQRDTWIDRAITGMVSVALAMPGFWIALILVFFFAIRLQWLPAAGYFPLSDGLESWLKGFILPWLALGLGALASLTRHTRSAMIEQFSSSYVRALIARGCPKRKIIFCYCLKNAMVPVLAILGMMMTIMLSGSFVIEIVFALPGLGSLIVESIDLGDAPMLQAIVVTVAIFIILVNYFIDLGYGLLNPKMRPE